MSAPPKSAIFEFVCFFGVNNILVAVMRSCKLLFCDDLPTSEDVSIEGLGFQFELNVFLESRWKLLFMLKIMWFDFRLTFFPPKKFPGVVFKKSSNTGF